MRTSCSPAVRLAVPETTALGPLPPSLLMTRTLSMNSRKASSDWAVNVTGPGWLMAIIPVQRTPKLVPGALAPKEFDAAGELDPKLKVLTSPLAALTAAVWKVGVLAMDADPR